MESPGILVPGIYLREYIRHLCQLSQRSDQSSRARLSKALKEVVSFVRADSSDVTRKTIVLLLHTIDAMKRCKHI